MTGRKKEALREESGGKQKWKLSLEATAGKLGQEMNQSPRLLCKLIYILKEYCF